jgi:hypothetical protein
MLTAVGEIPGNPFKNVLEVIDSELLWKNKLKQ